MRQTLTALPGAVALGAVAGFVGLALAAWANTVVVLAAFALLVAPLAVWALYPSLLRRHRLGLGLIAVAAAAIAAYAAVSGYST